MQLTIFQRTPCKGSGFIFMESGKSRDTMSDGMKSRNLNQQESFDDRASEGAMETLYRTIPTLLTRRNERRFNVVGTEGIWP